MGTPSSPLFNHHIIAVIFPFLFFSFFFFSMATRTAYGGSQARSLIGAVAAGQCQSHSNGGSEPRLQPTQQLTEQGQGSNQQTHGS